MPSGALGRGSWVQDRVSKLEPTGRTIYIDSCRLGGVNVTMPPLTLSPLQSLRVDIWIRVDRDQLAPQFEVLFQ